MKHPVVFRSLLLAVGVLLMLSLKAQDTEKPVSLNVRNARLSEVLNTVRKSTGLNFFYSVDDLDRYPTVTINVSNKPLSQLLNQLLESTDMRFTVEKNTIIIKRKPAAEAPAKKNIDTAVVIKGTVLGTKGAPLGGASVTDVNTGRSAITDAAGKFTLTTRKRTTLLVSFVGMKQKSVAVRTDAETLTQVVNLEEAPNEMKDVVVTGYQTIRKAEMVGSANTIKREDMLFDGTNNLEQMLQGKLPGTVVMNQSGLVGTRPKVRVRGTSTLLSNQEPVWVVDGIIQTDPIPFQAAALNDVGSNADMMRNLIGNSISWLNPNDIEDVTVLKDAAATVLYGVKAANGVIVIKTKKGKAGRMAVNYAGGFAITEKLQYDKLNLMNSKERIDVSREITERGLLGRTDTYAVGYENAYYRYLNKEISYAEFNQEVKRLETVNTNWIDLLYRTPLSHNHSISLSGGTDRVSYYSSVSMSQNFGIAKGNDSKSMNGTINMDAKLTDKLTVSVRLSGNFSTTSGFYIVDPFKYAQEASRAIPAYTADGKYQYYDIRGRNYVPVRFNVLNELNETGNQNDQRTFNSTLLINYNIISGLRFESQMGISSTNANGETWASEFTHYIAGIRGYEVGQYMVGTPQYSQSKLPHGGEYNSTESRNIGYNFRNSLAFNKMIGAHRFGVLAGQELRSTKSRGFSATTFGYFPNRGRNISLPPRMITSIQGNPIANPIYEEMQNSILDRDANFISYYGSVTYSYDERYVFTGSLRSDASNRFGQDSRKRFLPIWAGGVRWNVHNEPWMKNQRVVSELNLRASYGWQGNVAENFGPDLIAQIPKSAVNPITAEQELKIKSLGYADLRWEKTKTMNLGVDVGIAANRFIFSLEYYKKRTEDMIIYKEVPLSYGILNMPVNGGNMENEGLELVVSGTIIRTSNLVWNMSFNTSRNTNRVASNISRSEDWLTAASGRLNKEGYGVSSFWVFTFNGLDPKNGYPTFDLFTKDAQPAPRADATTYMKYAGRLEPDFTAGISNSVRYKQFTLSASFNMQLGGKKMLYNIFERMETGGSELPSAYYNLPKEFVNRWKKPGDEKFTNIPAIPSGIYDPATNTTNMPWMFIPSNTMTEYLYNMYNYSDARVVNASFLRCNDISLSWNLPERTIRYLGVKSMTVGAAVRNPFIIVSKDFKGMDPEVATGNQPIPRVYSMQLNVSF